MRATPPLAATVDRCRVPAHAGGPAHAEDPSLAVLTPDKRSGDHALLRRLATALPNRASPAPRAPRRPLHHWLTGLGTRGPLATAEPWRLLVGAGSVLLPGVVLATIHPALPVSVPGIVFMVAIAFSTALADWVGGATALALAALVLDTLFVGQRPSLAWPRGPAETLGFGITLVSGGALICLIEWIKRAGSVARLDAAAARAAANALTALGAPSSYAPGTAADFDHALDTILTAMIRVSRAHTGAILLAQERDDALVRAVAYGLADTGSVQPSLRLGEGFAGRVARERRPLTTVDIATDPRFADSPLRETGVRSLLGVPLIGAGDRLLGVAHIGLLVPHQFSATDIARLEALAARGAGWLDAVHATDQQERLLRRTREERERLAMIIAAMPEAVVVVEPPDGRVVACNDAAVRLLGPLDGERAAHTAFARLHRPDGAALPASELPLTRALTAGAVVTGVELVVQGEEGEAIPILVSAAPLRHGGAEIQAVVGVFQDIRRLKEADRVKDEFVSAVSHELRSPLTPIRGFVQLVARELEREGGHPTHVAWLHSIEGHVDRMTRLVDDLLDAARLRAGRLEIRPEPTDLVTLCQGVLRAQRAAATEHELLLDVAPPTLIGWWDPDRLHQVIENLVSNAVKYSPPGSTVRLAIAEAPAEDAVHVSVSDQGPGVPPALRPEIFAPFYRTVAATASRTPGLGLGLFISRELVLAHGGTIAVADAPGGGACFTVTLPRGAVAETLAVPA